MQEAVACGVGPSRSERALLLLAIVSFYVGGYFFVGRLTDPSEAESLMTSLDGWIPFIPSTVWVYLSIFIVAPGPAVLLSCRTHLRWTTAAYGLVIAITLVLFLLYPVTSIHLRADPSGLEGLTGFALRTLYAIDPPLNLFPSLHVAVGVLAASVMGQQSPSYRWLARAWALSVAVVVCTTKQHFLVDSLSGGLLGALAGLAVGRLHVGRVCGSPPAR